VVGPIPGHLYRAGYLQREELQTLARQGVVGDIGTVFLRADGSSEALPINSRSSGLPIEALKMIPKRICIALGPAKAPVIRAALLAGAITDLVVDDAAADLLALHA
jgi:deoxyribonucleoside regulator